LSGSAAAQAEVGISAADTTVESDDGTVERVMIAPELTLSWSGFDQRVERVRILVEARQADGDYMPVFRSTPWLHAEDNDWTPGTSGEETFGTSVFGVRGAGEDFDEGARNQIEIANAVGVPVYTDANLSHGTSEETYLDGTSIGKPTTGYDEIVNYTYNPETGWKFGYYGAAANATEFPVPRDGEQASVTMAIRYTVSLHRDEDYSPLTVYDQFANKLPSGADDATSIPRSVLVNGDEHPAITTTEASFDVHAKNLPPTTTVSGASNTDSE
jgi:hypothetical protein